MIEYFTNMRGAVSAAVKQGLSREQAIPNSAHATPQYADFRPGQSRFRDNVGNLYDETKAPPKP